MSSHATDLSVYAKSSSSSSDWLERLICPKWPIMCWWGR